MLRRIAASVIFRSSGLYLVDPTKFDINPKVSEPAAEPPTKFDSTHSRSWWATRDAAGASSAQAYWDMRQHPLRTEIGKTVSALGGTSLLEVGCHAGMNLWAASRFRKWERLAGTELSQTVLDFTKQTLPAAVEMNVDLSVAAADSLSFEDRSFDIVLTSGTLVCIGPDQIEASLQEICRVSRRYIVLVEPLEIDPRFATPHGREDPYPNTMYWIRDYTTMLADMASPISVTTLRKEQQIGHQNSILVFEIK